MFLFHKHIAAVSASMFTWEVTTAFDGTLSETELKKRFEEDFGNLFGARNGEGCEACDSGECANRVFFWPLVSFNASDGRKHRYLVVKSRESLEKYRKKFDRCLPQQVVLYAVADKILRGERIAGLICADMPASGSVNAAIEDCADSNGNLILVALWKNCLYILVFAKGRLCHWSEEFGYGDCFDERCQIRVERFKSFLKADELFAGSDSFSEVRVGCDDLLDMGNLFETAAKDSFWSGLDLDNCETMKPCEKQRWTICAAMLLMLGLALVFICSDSWIGLYLRTFANERFDEFVDVAPVELSSPATHDLEMLAWAEGHRDLLPAKWTQGRDGSAEGSFGMRRSRWACDSLDYKLLGIVGGRVALMESAMGESKMLSVGDSLFRYRVKVIGKNEVLLRCGHKEVRYEVGTADVSQVGAR
jgi:hypothetical protein